MLPIFHTRAPLSDFALPRSPILVGQALKSVRELEASIARFGLLAPVVVTRGSTDGRWTVVDGRKRLLAIRRLGFGGNLPSRPHTSALVNPLFTEVNRWLMLTTLSES